MSEAPYAPLVDACEALFAEHGDTYLGQGWTKSQANTDRRHDVMLDLLRDRSGPVTLLDFGCGTGQLLDHIRARRLEGIDYTGLDVSEVFVSVAREKHPEAQFLLGDLLAGGVELPHFDYVVMNGLFTYKGPLSFAEMAARWQRLVLAVMEHARIGVAFNTTSPYVDWERDDLFHAPLQLLADVVARSPCPYFRIRHDYGLFESAVHAYREPLGG